MAKSTLLHPQFFHTLVHGFHTHLMIPLEFFSKYIEGKTLGKTTAELKSDSSEVTWKVKMTGRRLSEGWEEFAVAYNFQTGDVLLVRYEGDMIFHVSDLGPSCCEIQDNPPPRNDIYGQFDVGKTLLKKRLYPRTQVDFSPNDGDGCDDEDDMEPPRKKKVKKNSPEAETASSSDNSYEKNNPEAQAVSSSSSDNSCFVAVVTPSSLRTDTLYLPQHVTSSSGFTRKCRKIVLIDGGERSWALDLRFKFNKSSDTFYISRGWRRFCEENGQEAGGFFMFKLVGNGETPVLSFDPTKTYNKTRQRECSEASRRESLSTEVSSEEENVEGESGEEACISMESLVEIEKTKCSPKRRVQSYSSYLPSHKRFVTFTLPPDYVRIQNLYLPRPFVRENGINKPGEISLLGKDGTKWPTNLLMNMRGTMSFGQGWKDFVKANGVESGFTLKLIWEDTTPVLSLCCAESTNDMEQEEYFKAIKKQSRFIDQSNRDKISKDENTKEERRKNHLSGGDSTPSSQKQFVTLTITPSCFSTSKLRLPKSFTRENDINKPGTITLLGKDGVKYQTSLLFESRNRRMTLGKGWKVFAEANDLKLGDPFTFKLTWERTTPVLSLCPAECSIDKEAGGECLPIDDNNRKDNGKEETRSGREKNHLRGRDPTPSSQKQFVTLTITPTSFAKSRLLLPMQFVRENSINKPGMIYLLGRDGTKWPTNLVQNKKGVMGLGKGCKDFAEANDLKTGESFTMELIWKDGTRMLRLFNTKSSSSKAKEKESVSTEARSRDSLFQTKSSSSKANEKDSVSTEPRSRDSLFHTMSSSSKAKEKELVSTKPRSRDSLFHTESSCSKAKEKESDPTEAKSRESLFHTKSCSSKAKEKESVSTEARSRDSSSEILNRFVILTLTLENVRARILHLPSQFMKANGIKKLGKITILGRNGMEFSAYLLARDGIIALENGWDKFCEANGVKLGETFTLEFINEPDKTTPVLKFCSRNTCFSSEEEEEEKESSESDEEQNLEFEGEEESSEGDEMDSLSTEPESDEENNLESEGGEEESSEGDDMDSLSTKPECDEESNQDEKNFTKPRSSWTASSSSPSENRFVTLTLRAGSLKNYSMYFPRAFTRIHGINEKTKMTLLGKNDVKSPKWSTELRSEDNGKRIRMKRGWIEFFRAHCVKIGESIRFELIWEGDASCVLKFCSKVTQET